jgi:hypothetical protein
MTACILFLDFDGVLHPEPCTADELFLRLPLLQDVLLCHPAVQVVISSSWRLSHPLPALKKRFQPQVRHRVIGVTSSLKSPGPNWLPGQRPQYIREWECMAWLQQHCSPVTRWVAIDDCKHWFRPNCPDLLLTDGRYGMRAVDAEQLDEMLKERL